MASKLETPKVALEEFYSRRLEDKAIDESEELKTAHADLLAKAEAALNEFNHSIKPIKNAVVS